MFTKILGFVSTIASIVGIIAFFNHSVSLLCWCAVISIVNSFIQVVSGEQNNLSTEIGTVFIFLIISFFTETTWFVMIAFGLCLADALMSIIGWIAMFISMKRNSFFK